MPKLTALALLTALAAFLPICAWSQASPSPFTSGVRYDAAGRVTGTISADPDWTLGGANGGVPYQAVRTTYDAAGRVTKVEKGYLSGWQPDTTEPRYWSGFTVVTVVDTGYDAMGRKVGEAVSPAGGGAQQYTQWSYDGLGRPECTAVRMNPGAFGGTGACSLGPQGSHGPDRITRNVYDAAGQLLQVQKAVGTGLQQNYATYEYTPNGKRRAVIDANGNRAEMGWDGHDRQASWVFPHPSATGQVNGGDYEAYGYDENGNRTSLKKRDGRTIAYAYDALNRVTSKTYPNGGARGVYYAYDLRGLQTAARYDGPGGGDAVTTSYTGFGEIASSTTAMGGTSRTLSYLYDADGGRVRVTWPDGAVAQYHRYDTGQLYYADNAVIPLFHTPLDAAGRVAALYRWGVSANTWNTLTAYGYDGIGRVTALNHGFSAGNNVATSLSYNPAGQIVSRSRDNDAYAFTGYVNVARGYARNGLNQYTSAGPASFGYDANGNLTSDGSLSYGYDIENRLTSASNGAQLAYDPTGRLWQTWGTGHGTRQYLYDGSALVAEYDGGGTLQQRYVHGDGEDVPLVQFAGAQVTSPSYLFTDHQGSVVALADANGAVTSINRYDEYGIPAGTNTGRFQYTGQAWLPDIGMYHYKARIYSPTLGRFLQTDPIGYDDQVNLYAYVENDPVNGTDPTGLCGDFDLPGQCGYLKGGPSESEQRDTARRQDTLHATPEGSKNSTPGIGHNNPPSEEGPPGRPLTAWGRVASVLGALLSLGGDSCSVCNLKVDNILNDPRSLEGVTLDQFRSNIDAPSNWAWTRGVKGQHANEVWTLREWGGKDWTGRMIRWHPGGGRHGPESYWRVNGGHGQAARVKSGGRW